MKWSKGTDDDSVMGGWDRFDSIRFDPESPGVALTSSLLIKSDVLIIWCAWGACVYW